MHVMAAAHVASNPRLLLLHAAGLDRGSWDAVVARIPGFARTLAIDLPGHGTAPGLTYDRYDADAVPRLADHVTGRLAELGVRRPHVVGHSLGAAVALELACRVPVAAVTAFCPIGFRSPNHTAICATKIRALLRLVGAIGPAARDRLLRRPIVRRLLMSNLSARPAAIDAAVAAADIRSMIDSDLATLSRYACRYLFPSPERLADTPVNLVWAGKDRVVPPGDAARARHRLPHAQHTVIPNCGHLVMRDDPDGTAAVVHASHVTILRGHGRRAI